MMRRSNRHRRTWLLGTLVLAGAVPLAAQEAGEDDPFAEVFFDPELVMQNRQRVGITDAQWDEISGELRQLQRDAVDFEWEMAEAAQELIELASGDRIDEPAALEAARRIFAVENQIKVIQMQMLIRIKNVLTPQQQTQLRNIRSGLGT